MYNNQEAGAAFMQFLTLLGDIVRLKGFESYRAQLDTKTDSTGTHSLYTTYQDHEIMFHVSTMLPYTPNNQQQVCQGLGQARDLGSHGGCYLSESELCCTLQPPLWPRYLPKYPPQAFTRCGEEPLVLISHCLPLTPSS